MDLIIIIKFEFINNIHNLTKKNSVFHIVIGVFKSSFYNGFFDRRLFAYYNTSNDDISIGISNILTFQHREQFIVDKIQKIVTCQSLSCTIINRPVPPTTFLRDDRSILFVIKFPIAFFGIVDFQKKHPSHLFNTLRIAINAGIIAHDIPYSFHKI